MLAIGESRYGEKYTQAVETTGYAVQTLMHMVHVASRIAPERRHPELSFSAHKEAARLEPAEQAIILAKAAEQKWSSRDVAEAVRTYRRELQAPPAGNLPAREDSPDIAPVIEVPTEIAEKGPPPPLALVQDDEPEDLDAMDLGKELEAAQEEIDQLRAENESLAATDLGAEVRKWTQKYAQLEGRLRQAITTGNEAARQAKYQGQLLQKIRKALNVERDSQILDALMRRAA